MTLAEQEEVKKALLRGEITWRQALDGITKSLVKPWETKEWAELRSRHIKQYCEQCNSEKDLTLQHLKQPISFASLRRIVHNHFLEEYKEEHPIHAAEPPPVKRDACPRCSSTAIYHMKTGDQKWKCHGKKMGESADTNS